MHAPCTADLIGCYLQVEKKLLKGGVVQPPEQPKNDSDDEGAQQRARTMRRCVGACAVMGQLMRHLVGGAVRGSVAVCFSLRQHAAPACSPACRSGLSQLSRRQQRTESDEDSDFD